MAVCNFGYPRPEGDTELAREYDSVVRDIFRLRSELACANRAVEDLCARRDRLLETEVELQRHLTEQQGQITKLQNQLATIAAKRRTAALAMVTRE